MANSKSAEKRARQTLARTQRNRAIKSRIRTARRRVDDALESGDADKAKAAASSVCSAVDKAAKSGAIHKNAASRLKSRLHKAVAAKG